MNNDDLLRYSKQILLPEIDIEGQNKLLSSKVFIIGMGGLGTIVSEILIRSGVGSIFLCDDDKVEISNLHRQFLYQEEDLGSQKTKKAFERLRKINKNCEIKYSTEKVTTKNLELLAKEYKFIIDCTDNFDSRYLINSYCHSTKKFLISASVIGWKGQWFTIDFSKNSTCYECIFGFSREKDLTCAESGVSPSMVGVIGSMQANEAIKSIIGLFNQQELTLNQYDGQRNRMSSMQITKDLSCRICN